MSLSIFEYNPDKTKPEETSRAIDALGLLETMSEMEEYTGTTESKIYEIYYEVKRQLKAAILAEAPKKADKK